jgi:hypothetical protein
VDLHGLLQRCIFLLNFARWLRSVDTGIIREVAGRGEIEGGSVLAMYLTRGCNETGIAAKWREEGSGVLDKQN